MANFDVYVITPDGQSEVAEGEVASVPGQSENQEASGGMLQRIFGERKVPAERLEESWKNTNTLLRSIITDSVEKEEKGFSLDEMEVALSITAEGNIAFVSASANASITLKFKRR